MNLVGEIVAMEEELGAWRRDLHAHPELGYAEHRTSALVAERLEAFGCTVHRGLAGTGVVGSIVGRGEGRGRAIGLRADMDALPMTERTGLAHASTEPGRMHACGHDGHTTMLLGAARHLARTRDFAGTLHVIFQPAEEMLAGGERMVREGLFDRFPCDEVYAIHTAPQFAPGTIGVRPGPVLASADGFEILLTGRGGHGAYPHATVDPVVVGAHVVTALQTLVSREIDPLQAAVVSVTRIQAGSADNVIAAEAVLGGTLRAFEPAVRQRLRDGIVRVATAVATALRATAVVRFAAAAYPPTVASETEARHAARVAASVVGDAHVVWNHPPAMGAEDFSFMLQRVPGAFVMLGSDGGDDPIRCHDPRFDFNDRTLAVGASFWVRLVEDRLALRS